MDAWSRLFPNKHSDGPCRHAKFIMSEIKQGINNMVQVKDDAPMLSLLEDLK